VFINHSFQGDENYFLKKNFLDYQFQKEISFHEIEKHLGKDKLIISLDKHYSFVIHQLDKVPKLEEGFRPLVDHMHDYGVFLTDIYSLFGDVTYLEGRLDQDKFQMSIQRELKRYVNTEKVIRPKESKGFFSFLKKSKSGLPARVEAVCEELGNLVENSHFHLNALQKQRFRVFSFRPERKRFMMAGSRATRFAPFSTDEQKSIQLCPTPNGFQLPKLDDGMGNVVTEKSYRTVEKESIRFSAINPAKVLRHDPFVVTVYSSSLDCVVNLNYPQPIGDQLQKQFAVNQKLISVNSYLSNTESGYAKKGEVEIDLIEGERSNKYWKNVIPKLASFCTHDKDQVLIDYILKNLINKEEWQRLDEKNKVFFEKYPGGCRLGFLIYNRYPTSDFLQKYHLKS
jgi:hypothetical protein